MIKKNEKISAELLYANDYEFFLCGSNLANTARKSNKKKKIKIRRKDSNSKAEYSLMSCPKLVDKNFI